MFARLSLSAVVLLSASSGLACTSLFGGALKKRNTLVGSETIKECKQIPESRAGQDSAKAYVLSNSGTLYRVFDIETKKNPYLACPVKSDVMEYKLSNHAEDASLVYFVSSEGDIRGEARNYRDPAVLYRLEPGADPRGANCPSSKPFVHQIGYHIARKDNGKFQFSVVPNGGSSAMVVGNHTHQIIAIWDKSGDSFNAPSVADWNNGVRAVDFEMNPNFRKPGAPASSILAFVQLNNGMVQHVRDAGTGRELQRPVQMQGATLDCHVKRVTGRQCN